MTQSNVSNSRTERRFDTNSVLECVCLSVCLSVCVCVVQTSIRQGRLRLTVAQHPTVKVTRMTKPPRPISEYISTRNTSTNSWRLDRIPANHCLSKNVHRPTTRMPAPDSWTTQVLHPVHVHSFHITGRVTFQLEMHSKYSEIQCNDSVNWSDSRAVPNVTVTATSDLLTPDWAATENALMRTAGACRGETYNESIFNFTITLTRCSSWDSREWSIGLAGASQRQWEVYVTVAASSV